MKKTIFLIVSIITLNSFSQATYTDTSFKEKIFSLKITQRDYISDKSFSKGEFIFGEAIKDSLKSAGDYRNLAVALSYLDEDINLIEYAINKAFSLNSNRMLDLYKYLKAAKPIRYKRDLKWFPSINKRLLKLERKRRFQ